MDAAAERREFEKAVVHAYKDVPLNLIKPPIPNGPTYQDQTIDSMWLGWQLARKRGPCVCDGPCLLKNHP